MLKPLQDFVLIEVDDEKEKQGALFVVEEWKSLPPTGTIVEVGPQVVGLKAGTRVQFERYSSVILEDNLRLCKESHIYGVLDDEKA